LRAKRRTAQTFTASTAELSVSTPRAYDINGKAQKGRNCAKTFIYAFLYGAGPEKIGKTIGKGLTAGKRTISEFLAKTPALKRLKEKVAEAADRGYLKALDGRHMHIRSKHAALNTLLQGAGADLQEVDRRD
jgi:DNA polymerase-1